MKQSALFDSSSVFIMSPAIFELNLVDENVDKHTSFSCHVLEENPYFHIHFFKQPPTSHLPCIHLELLMEVKTV